MPGFTEEVHEDLPIKKADTMTSLTVLELGNFTSLHKSSPQVCFITFMLELDSLKAIYIYIFLIYYFLQMLDETLIIIKMLLCLSNASIS